MPVCHARPGFGLGGVAATCKLSHAAAQPPVGSGSPAGSLARARSAHKLPHSSQHDPRVSLSHTPRSPHRTLSLQRLELRLEGPAHLRLETRSSSLPHTVTTYGARSSLAEACRAYTCS
eukprot:3054501-Rhodomonas_salina.2